MSNEQERKLHPLTIVYSAFRALPQLFIAFFIVRNFQDGIIELVISAIIGIIFLPAILIHYFNFHFSINSEGITVKSGLFFKNIRSIPLDRIQNVDIRQNGFQRALKIAVIRIETAGGKAPEAKLEYVGIKHAHDIRDEIQGLQSERKGILSDNPLEKKVIDSEIILSLNNRALLRGAITKLSPVVLFLLGVFGQYNFIFQKLIEENQSVHDAVNWIVENYVLLSIIAIVTIIFVSWIGGILVHIARYYKFTVKQSNKTLTTDSGLIGKWHSVIPRKKIQSIARRANPIMRLLGLEYVEIHTAGSSENGSKTAEVLVPVMPINTTRDMITNLFQIIFPEHYTTIHSRNAFIYCAIRDSIILSIPTLILAFVLNYYFLLGFLGLVPILFLELYRLKARGYLFEQDYLHIRSGLWTITRVAIPFVKIQAVTFEQSVFEKIFFMATVTVSTAGGGVLRVGRIPYLQKNEAGIIVEKLMRNYQESKKKRRLLKITAAQE